jgi:hypothetical protein
MTRSLLHLRNALLGLAVAGALGFGTSQAVAAPEQAAAVRYCPDQGVDYYYAPCGYSCPGGRGYCAEGGICRCGYIP